MRKRNIEYLNQNQQGIFVQSTNLTHCNCSFLYLPFFQALIELFSEMFGLIVELTTSEWKIISRQIGYEHGDSGNPVLAVFCGGSICAMIACEYNYIFKLNERKRW